MKNVLIIAAIAITIISTLGACVPAPPQGLPRVIPVGCVMATASAPAVGPNLINAAKLAVSEINSSGGINGSSIDLIVEDEGPTPASALLALHKLIEVKKVQAVIGCTNSSIVMEAGPYISGKRVPVVSPSATASNLSRQSWSNWVFRVSPDDSLQAGVAAKLIKDRELKKVAILYQDTVYGRGIAEAAPEFLKGRAEIVARVSYDQAKLSYLAELNSIRDKKPDCVFHIGYYDDSAVVYRQAGELGMGDIPWLTVDGPYDLPLDKYLDAAKFMEKSVTGTVPIPDLQSEIYGKLKTNYRISYQIEPTIYCDTVYDGVKLIAQAVKKANTYYGPAIRDALAEAGREFKGASGTITLDDTGARTTGTYGIWKVQTVGTQYKFVLTGESVNFLKPR